MNRASALLAVLLSAASALAQEANRTASIAPPTTTAPAHALRYRFVPEKSDFHFELPTTFHLVRGSVPKWSGGVVVEPGTPGTLRARIVIDSGALSTSSRARDAKMHARVLESPAFPEIVFEAGTYKGDLANIASGRSVTAEVVGQLTVHGVTVPVQTSVECEILTDHAVVAGAVPVHWKDFKLHDPSLLMNRVRDPLTVIFRLWAEPER